FPVNTWLSSAGSLYTQTSCWLFPCAPGIACLSCVSPCSSLLQGWALPHAMAGCFCCCRKCPRFLSEEDRAAVLADKEIQKMLREQKKQDRREVKLLLLGPGESGKSTFIKQMRIIHGAGYSEEDCKAFTKLVYQNIFAAMQAMIGAMETLQIPYARPENVHHAQLVMGVDAYKVVRLDEPYVSAIGELWRDAGIRTCYERRREYHLLDSAFYFLSNLERIVEDAYIPTAQDVLRSRRPTTGINEYCFSVKKVTLRIVDVGGQKSERKKWIHCFENVIALIYLASLSEYDQRLEENSQENRMKESLALFRIVLELPWFQNASVILFLNKTDILEDKIAHSDLADCFPAFPGPKQDAEAAKHFILEMYTERYKQCSSGRGPSRTSKTRCLYHHFTCATDTQNIRKVLKDVRDVVLASYLDDINLL
ncbi:PREDICTED: guanine nucleotide-binding protein subunit alpha-15, partial [Crocodylus porosus]|uniref:guanine nucleotide-binding protein subunit alpha-15 n=1 Tax=Crocodylus porosus TaxID=8502 RepID=UPI00093D1407